MLMLKDICNQIGKLICNEDVILATQEYYNQYQQTTS